MKYIFFFLLCIQNFFLIKTVQAADVSTDVIRYIFVQDAQKGYISDSQPDIPLPNPPEEEKCLLTPGDCGGSTPDLINPTSADCYCGCTKSFKECLSGNCTDKEYFDPASCSYKTCASGLAKADKTGCCTSVPALENGACFIQENGIDNGCPIYEQVYCSGDTVCENGECVDKCSGVELGVCQKCDSQTGEIVSLADNTPCSTSLIPNGICLSGVCVIEKSDGTTCNPELEDCTETCPEPEIFECVNDSSNTCKGDQEWVEVGRHNVNTYTLSDGTQCYNIQKDCECACPASKPYEIAGSCFECQSNADCGGSKPYCNTLSSSGGPMYSCVECISADDCGARGKEGFSCLQGACFCEGGKTSSDGSVCCGTPDSPYMCNGECCSMSEMCFDFGCCADACDTDGDGWADVCVKSGQQCCYDPCKKGEVLSVASCPVYEGKTCCDGEIRDVVNEPPVCLQSGYTECPSYNDAAGTCQMILTEYCDLWEYTDECGRKEQVQTTGCGSC